jgi:hypothetical protein
MATISSISAYLARTHDASCYVQAYIYEPDSNHLLYYNSSPSTYTTLIGQSDLVAYNDIPDAYGAGPGWVTLTCSTPVTVTKTGFYGIKVIVVSGSTYDLAGIRWYGASDWSDASSGSPYVGKERSFTNGTPDEYTRAYAVSGVQMTSNSAITPNANYYTASQYATGHGLRVYLDGNELLKATIPTPADGSGPGIDFSTRTLSWVDGGGADTYTVRIGPYPTAYNVVSASQADTSYVIPESDIALYKDNPITWRVDSEAGGETVEGDVWTFDPRPAKAANPSPTDGEDGTDIGASLSWDAAAEADSYVVYPSWGDTGGLSTEWPGLVLAGYVPVYLDALTYNHEYTWSAGTVNEWGETDGDDWTFETLALDPPTCSYTLLPGMTLGPLDGGTEGIDFIWNGSNNMRTTRYLVAAANNRIWYETF